MFNKECNNFLDTITNIRNTAITQAVNDAIAREHTPYATKLLSTRDLVIAEERKKTEEMIESLKLSLANTIAKITTETETAVSQHKANVTAKATQAARASYDTFILGVSKLVDETNNNLKEI